MLTLTYGCAGMATYVQHGDNPEHRLIIDDEVAAATLGNEQVVLNRWCESLHEFEDDPEAWIASAIDAKGPPAQRTDGPGDRARLPEV